MLAGRASAVAVTPFASFATRVQIRMARQFTVWRRCLDVVDHEPRQPILLGRWIRSVIFTGKNSPGGHDEDEPGQQGRRDYHGGTPE